MSKNAATDAGSSSDSGGTPKTKHATLASHLGKLVNNKEWADVKFLVGPEATPVYACKNILSVRSLVFRSMFKGGFKESLSSSSSSETSNSNDKTKTMTEVALPEVPASAFLLLLHIIHTDTLLPRNPERQQQREDLEDLIHLYSAGEQFMVPQAKELARQALQPYLQDPQLINQLQALELAVAVAPGLVDDICAFLSAHAKRLLGNKEPELEARWLALSLKAMAELISFDLLGLEEVEVFSAVHRWHLHRQTLTKQVGRAQKENETEEGEEEDEQLRSREDVKKEEEEEEEAKDKESAENAAGEELKNNPALDVVLDGLELALMTGQEILEVVQPTGLFSLAQLNRGLAVAATNHRFILRNPNAALPRPGASYRFPEERKQGRLKWTIELVRDQTTVALYFRALAIENAAEVSLEGVQVRVFDNRMQKFIKKFGSGSILTCENKQGWGDLGFAITAEPEVRITVLVYIPRGLFQ
ncbi:BTB/POZ domain-containing protein 19 [Balamuthia mandrillaris]